jgi:hypothetical protein
METKSLLSSKSRTTEGNGSVTFPLPAGVCVCRLDLEEKDHGWEWKREEVSCNSSLQ